MLQYSIGQLKQYDGEIYVVTSEGDAGCVLYGPYCTLWPGSYEVEFYAMPQELGTAMCCVVDVLRHGSTITAEKDFTATELVFRNGVIPVRFEVIETDTFEFRLTSTGQTGLKVRYRRPLRQLSAPGAEASDRTSA